MINSVLQGLISFLINSISFFTSPINSIIEEYVPSLTSAISAVNDFINWLIKFIVYIVSWVNLPSEFWALLVAITTLCLLLPLLTHVIKLALRWYRMIMP